jgi:hypothetical protein
MSRSSKRRVIEAPQITVNKLGEFLEAKPDRQRKILEMIKYPDDNTFGSNAYSTCRPVIKKFFVSGFDEEPIKECIEKLESKKSTVKDYALIMVNSEIDALKQLLSSKNLNKDLTYTISKSMPQKIILHGVEISIFPDLMTYSKIKGKEFFGIYKIHISKSGSLNKDASKHVSTLLFKYAEDYITEPDKILRKNNCLTYDVFADTVIESPSSVHKRWLQIEAACQNIAAIWPTIQSVKG